MARSDAKPDRDRSDAPGAVADPSMELPDIDQVDLKRLLEATPDLVVLTDGRRFLYMNRAASRFLGSDPRSDHADLDPGSVIPASERASLTRAIQRISSERAWHGETLLERHDGAIVPFSAVAFETSRTNSDQRVFAAIFRDLSTQKAYELELESTIHVEELTGLANRRRLLEELGSAIRSGQEQRTDIGLIAVDIDRFKFVNETLGPAAGDRLLVAVADRIQLAVRTSDIVARLSGDEFVVLCTELESETLQLVAERIREALSHPFTIAQRELSLTVSLGIVDSASRRTDPETLLQDAIAAIHEAKEQGGNRIARFDPVRRLQIASRLELEQELRMALRNDEFELAYQNEVWLTSEELVCLEALIRWRHPERGLVPPDQFIPLAEETGLILSIGNWVIAEVCRQLREWRAAGLDGMSVSINISPRQLAQADFPQILHAMLEQEEIRPNQINLEITESVMTEQSRSFVSRIRDLRQAGFTMIMDDFGTGYSSLSQLRSLPFSILKIDKSFVLDLIDEEADRQLVDAMIRMAHALGRIVVAEGVETAEHAEILTDLSCEIAQGWYFGRPVPGREITDMLVSAREAEEKEAEGH
ncbi:MAG TPA: EAL domain-containing protein [Deltaproteobacteria bacterium]|nr:EAL domain-containing protein [Deltaproteobacteria bacterium]